MPSRTYSPELESSIRETVALCRSIRAGKISFAATSATEMKRLTRSLPQVWAILAKRAARRSLTSADCIAQLGGLTDSALTRFFKTGVAVL